MRRYERLLRRHRTNTRLPAHCDHRTGLTLIEVMAAVVILGASVTTMLVAQANAADRLKTAQMDSTAARIAHELIMEWRLTEEDVTGTAHGSIADVNDWRWRRTSQVIDVADGVTAVHVTLVIERDEEAARPWSRTFDWLEKHVPSK